MILRNWPIGLLLFICLPSELGAAIPPDATAEQSKAGDSISWRQHTQKELSYGRWISTISDAFKIPISFEWSHINADRSSEKHPEVMFSIDPGETLAETLDRFCAATDARLQWGRIEGIICVWASGTEGLTESLLDIRVDLNVQNASVWDAFLELARQVNANSQSGRYLKPEANPVQDEHLPPLELRHNYVKLDLVNVTAREAACAIMARSPLRMKFRYTNGASMPNGNLLAQLSIWAYDEKYRFLSHVPNPPSREEEVQWDRDAESVVPADH